MLLGHTAHNGTYSPLLKLPTWQQAFDWIVANKEKPDGEYEIKGRDMYAAMQTVQTIPRDQGIFEAHRAYIDLQFCITGGEVIEWAPVNALTAETKFDTEKDYAFYKYPPRATSLLLTPGTFAIFLPADAHMPKISDGINTSTKKVVIKIKLDLLGVS